MESSDVPGEVGPLHGPWAPLVAAVGVGAGGEELARALARHLNALDCACAVEVLPVVDQERIAAIVQLHPLLFVAEDDASPPGVGAALVGAARGAGGRALRVGPVSDPARRADDGRLLLARGTRLFEAAAGLAGAIAVPGLVGFDWTDVRDSLPPRPATVGVGTATSLLAATDAALACWPAPELAPRRLVLLNLQVAPTVATLTAIVDGANAVVERVHPDAEIRFAATVLGPSGPAAQVLLLLGTEAPAAQATAPDPSAATR